MTLETYYRQCALKRVTGQVNIAWIPEEFARKGHYLKIKRGGTWENGWQVLEVYSRQAGSQLLTCERDYLIQREASDI